MRRLFPLIVLAAIALAACGGTDRPEGVVERWLVSLNQGAAGRPGQYAPATLSERILPHWRSRDPGELEVIEVGKGRQQNLPSAGVSSHAPSHTQTNVPFRAKRTSGVQIDAVAVVVQTPTTAHVVAIDPPRPDLRVPSEGGPRIGQASGAAWGIALAIAAGLALAVMLLIRATPAPAPLPIRRDRVA